MGNGVVKFENQSNQPIREETEDGDEYTPKIRQSKVQDSDPGRTFLTTT